MAEKVFMIALSPTMEEGTILKWRKKEGEVVKEGDILCDVETDKASMEYESTQAGKILKIVRGEGTAAKVGDLIAILGQEGEDISSLLGDSKAPAKTAEAVKTSSPAQSAVAPTQIPQPSSAQPTGKASPLARRLAQEKGIDLNQIQGSGPGGRVIKRDLENYQPAASSKPVVPVAVLPSPLNDERIPVSRKRAVIASRLSESLFTAPHIFLTVTVHMDPLMNAREKINAELKEKLGLNSFIVKLAANAITRHQAINSSWMGDYIQNHSSVDVGLAVAQADGLITPIVRAAHGKGIRQIDAELKDLIDRARNNALKPEEYTGATFTISNLGSFGIEEFTAIINPPGAAILALGAVVRAPYVEEDGSFSVRRQMKMTLSADHRVMDGAVAAAFLTDLKSIIEDPFRALL